MLLPVVWTGLRWLLKVIKPSIERATCSWRAFWAFRLASWRISKACKSGDLSGLSGIMKKAVVDHYCLQHEERDITAILHDAGWDKQHILGWEEFARELLSYTQFAPSQPTSKSLVGPDHARVKALCKKACEWLNTFSKGPL